MPDAPTRKLAAIVSTDVVGYSRLMGEDEAGTLARMKAHRAELWTPEIDRHGGRIVGTAGDSLLVEFASAVSAVECSLAVQQGMAEREAGQPDDTRMLLRIGVNIGEVVVDGDDIYGDGVNVAARLQAIAPAGGICLSGKVHDEIAGKVDASFEDAGAQEVKNIARPVQVWRWMPALGGSETFAGTSAAPRSERPAIAVLPLDNMSGDPEQEYFADGITEDLITALSYQRLFPVLARNSTFAYKGKSVDVVRLGKELGVGYVIEGSVRKAGNRVRITVQLIEVGSGHHVWAQRYDRELADIFDLQDEITEALVHAIEPELMSYEFQKVRTRNPEQLSCWDCYLQGMAAVHRRTRQDLADAERLARQAIAIEPSSALGHSLLSTSMTLAYFQNWGNRSRASFEEMVKEAGLAVELEPRDAAALAAFGLLQCFAGQHDEALNAARRAIELNPYAFWPRMAMGNSLLFGGDIEGAKREYLEANRIGGADADMYHATTMMLWAEYLAANYAEAADWGRKTLMLNREYLQTHIGLAATYAQIGDQAAADRHMRYVYERYPGLDVAKFRRNLHWRDTGMIDHIVDGLRKAGLPD